MNTFEHKSIPRLHTEIIRTPEGDGASCCPERGGIITSIQFKGEEILYLDEATFQNLDENVKGGIPKLCPGAGPNESVENPNLKKYPDLKQHGFARNKKWDCVKTANGFVETLKSDADTRKIFPFDFSIRMVSGFEKDGSFNINESIKNLEKDKDLPVSDGLHPYFRIPNENKEDAYELKNKIEFNFKGGDFIKENIDKWANGKSISIKTPNTPMEVIIPSLGTLVLEVSKEYKHIWIWSQPGKDFICIEPVRRNKGGLIDDPEKIKPGEVSSTNFNIRLQK